MLTLDLDSLLDSIADEAAARSGASPLVLSARGVRLRPGLRKFRLSPKGAIWMEDEKAFLRANIGVLSDAEIGARLGRSAEAIKIRRTRLGYPAPTLRPGWMTANRAAWWLGSDVHAVCMLIRRGLLPAQVLPGESGILVLRKVSLYRFAVCPENWIYFRRTKVRDPHLRRLIEIQAARWDDEWWTPGQVGDYLGLKCNGVNHLVRKGVLRAKRWGNWWIKKSEVTRPGLVIWTGKGSAGYTWKPDVDAFLILGYAAGLSYTALNRLIGWPHRTAEHRLHLLRQGGNIPDIVRRYHLPVQYDPDRKLLFADWRDCAARFPSLVRLVAKFKAGKLLGHGEAMQILTLLSRWLAWFACPGPCMISPRWSREIVRAKLVEMQGRLRAIGVEPL